MKNYNYRKVEKGESFYEMIADSKNRGVWICDSYDHNEGNGCSNPDCFKHESQRGRNWKPPFVTFHGRM